MACFSISASLQVASGGGSGTHHAAKRPPPLPRAVAIGVEGQRSFDTVEKLAEQPNLQMNKTMEFSGLKFIDERWKKGTWDLNMFVKNGRMDWEDVIVSEARRRKFLEIHPEASTNQEPVLFRSTIIPWWAWLQHSYLPEAELLNGRAAMVGFFMSYVVDALTGMDVVGQTGNFICKLGLFITVVSVVLLRKTEDFENLNKVVDEATYYDKQWRSSWEEDQNAKL